MRIIALEEEFVSPELMQEIFGKMPEFRYTLETSSEIIGQDLSQAFIDLGDARIKAMDEAGIDVQVLSFCAPQPADPGQSVALMREGNDRAADAVRTHPGRFSAFAALPLADPKAAVSEFERALDTLGCVGGFVSGSVNGEFLDNRKFWPVLECAQAYDVPI